MKKGEFASNFSFSRYVFHSSISLVCPNAALCGNGFTKSGFSMVLHDNISEFLETLPTLTLYSFLFSSFAFLYPLLEKKPFENHEGISFSHSVFKRLVLQTCKNTSMSGKGLTLYHTILTFNNPEKQTFLKTLWKKEKMLVSNIFSFSNNVLYSFSHSVLYSSQIKFQFLSHIFFCLL